MKSPFPVILVLMLFAVFSCERGAKVPGISAPEKIDYEKIRQELIKAQYEYAGAWNNKDMNAISDVWSHDDDITIFGPAERNRVQGWEGPDGVKAWYQNALDSMARVDFKIHDILVKVTREGTAAVITYYVENDFIDLEGKSHKMTPRVTVVKELREGKWKQIHGDASFSIAEIKDME